MLAERTLGDKTSLKDKSGVDMIDDRIQDNTFMNGASYFSHYLSPSPCDITNGNYVFII